ncbi:unnamed protein product [Chironomus riparius]|uniref:Uncharacterized protein n=1 Tax=Chironomus riparius TaxID=315576 RepID=A0A9N9WPY9_9DIPT|nr:unnamed protein product [Chironomus riparius]
MVGKTQHKFLTIVKKKYLQCFDVRGDILMDKEEDFIKKIMRCINKRDEKKYVFRYTIRKFLCNEKLKFAIKEFKQQSLPEYRSSTDNQPLGAEHSNVLSRSLLSPAHAHNALDLIAINYDNIDGESFMEDETPSTQLPPEIMNISESIDFGESFNLDDLRKTDKEVAEQVDDTVIGGFSKISFNYSNRFIARYEHCHSHETFDGTIVDEE